ncbi:YceD family protein [Corynebacterium nuruki]|jgi:uncharacterized protein|uniref:YceD family protein n=1 Tax=Corynebacterium nuruki TaxID=1032851 RepID=UPI0039BEFCFD
MTTVSNNPFQLDVREALRTTGLPQHLTTSGPAPQRLGGEMLGVAEGAPVEIIADVTNLGESLLVDATLHGTATGQCSRCLSPLDEPLELHVSDVFGLSPDFITRDAGKTGTDDEDGEDDFEPLFIEEDRADLTQLFVDEAGLTLPFNPTCADYGRECDEGTPEPDGISEEQAAAPDPRWAGLAEKFGTTDEDGEN